MSIALRNSFDFKERLHNLRKLLAANNFNGVFIGKQENVYYYSGFSGDDSWLLVTDKQAFLITDSRYIEQARLECSEIIVLCQGGGNGNWLNLLVGTCKVEGIANLGFEGKHLTYNQYELLLGEFAKEATGFSLKNIGNLIDDTRIIKEEMELNAMILATAVNDVVFSEVEPFFKPGITEKELAAEINYAMYKLGAESLAFSTIVAAGKNGAIPHAKPSNYKIQPGDFVTIDFGANYKGYCGDMTRTIAIDHVDPKQREVYDVVLQAQKYAVANLKPGMTCGEVDALARNIITDAGYGKYFTHSLGHGVGLEIHEEPALRAGSDTVLQVGHVVTIEPGIYIPDWGGVRIEDTITVTLAGAKIFTHTPKELTIY